MEVDGGEGVEEGATGEEQSLNDHGAVEKERMYQ